MKRNNLLFAGAIANFAIAVLHLIIILIGGDAYRYFGAGEEMATMDEAGSLSPGLITLLVTFFFILFGLYGLSGAGKIRKLPLLDVILMVIASIFLMRGASVIADIYLLNFSTGHEAQMIWFSLVALVIGICYSMGIYQKRRTEAISRMAR
jgi:hypothetical protein